MEFWEAIDLFFNGTESRETILALEEYEAGVSLMSILSAFSIIGIIIVCALLLFVLIKTKDKKRIVFTISLIAVLCLFIANFITVNGALENIVADIVKNYPNAGYHLN